METDSACDISFEDNGAIILREGDMFCSNTPYLVSKITLSTVNPNSKPF